MDEMPWPECLYPVCMQAEYPLPYWPGVILFHSVYALFEARRFSNFQKYKEVR